MPKLTGTPISRAISEVTSVPTIGTSAPNCSVTGFHAESIKNPKPNFRIAGRLPNTNDKMMPTRIASTRKAKKRVIARKIRS